MTPIKVMSVLAHGRRLSKWRSPVLELDSRPEFESIVCVTAQHRQMLDGVLECFSITPDYDLDIMQSGQTLADITSQVLEGLRRRFAREAKNRPLFLCTAIRRRPLPALSAHFTKKCPSATLEAGLRTFDRYSPFPEEMNRCMVARLATYHFAPTAQNARNLRNENIRENVFVTGTLPSTP